MRNLRRRGKAGIWYAVVDIPADVRTHFEGRRQVWASLRTSNENDALRAAAQVVSDLKDQIEAARHGPVPAEALTSALVRWEADGAPGPFRREGLSPGPGAGRLWEALVEAAFGKEPWRHPGLDGFLIFVLKRDGIVLQPGSSRLRDARETLRETFIRMREMERSPARIRLSDYENAGEVIEEVTRPVPAPPLTPSSGPAAKPATGTASLDALTERYIAARQPTAKDAGEVRTYMRRLREFLDAPSISEVTPEALDRFKTELRRFPSTRRPEIIAKPFKRIIEEHGEDPDLGRLSNATIRRKWFGAFNRVFGYAVELELLARNPVTRVMPKKSEEDLKERKPFTAKDIAAMFSTPMYKGHSGAKRGYRTEAGGVIVKDAAYWLSILALWHGFRVEEIGAMKRAHLRQEEGVWVFDLTGRELKTRESRRLVPLHPRLIAMGFLDYHAAGEGEWLFPELPHDPQGKLSSTRIYTKWFGLWCDRNGFTDPEQSFHSFRHTFKRACREAGVTEEIHDLLTGHKGAGGIGRSYGRGVDLSVLADAMAKVSYPQFPL